MTHLRKTLAGCGATGSLVLAVDWARTTLGPLDEWPEPVAAAVAMALSCGFPASVTLGRDPARALVLYNDAFVAFLGKKHPAALGRPAREVWPETWDFFDWALRQVRQTGHSVSGKDLTLLVERGDAPEEIFASLSFSPIRDYAGDPCGAVVSGLETTAAVVGERRSQALRGLADNLCRAKTEDELYQMVALSLSATVKDVAFALLYALDPGGRMASLRAVAGVSAVAAEVGAEIDLGAGDGHPWDLSGVVREREMRVVAPRGIRLSAMVSMTGAPRLAAVVPVMATGHDSPLGVLVVGINPARPFDQAYDGFVRLVAHQIASALAAVRRLQDARRQAEAAAALDQAKSMFLTNVSHELRTPLALLLGSTEELLAEGSEPLSPAQRAELERVRRNANRLVRYVAALLDFARTDAGRGPATLEPTDLACFTREIVGAFCPLVERAGLRLSIDCPELPGPVPVAREMWEGIVCNLVSNALKFTVAGEIAVRLRASGDRVVLSVSDTGIGIPQEALGRIFERFYHVPGAWARTEEGLGIGLSLVKELVEVHRGTVRVTSARGAGTTVTVELPLGAPDLAAGPPRAPATPQHVTPFVEDANGWIAAPTARAHDARRPLATPLPGASEAAPTGRILVVEDCVDMRDYLTRLLGPTYEVETAASGESALTRARARPPDLVLSDVVMPDLDGLELLRALRDDPATADIPVVLVSARGGEEATLDALGGGADDYLVKPFSGRELRARVRTHLELARARREAGESRLKDVFLGLASHELRTPLTCLKLNVQLVHRQLEATDSRLAERLGGLSRAIDRMTRLVDEMLTISAISAGKLALRRSPCDLRDLCRGAAAEVCQVTRRDVRLDLPEDPVPAVVDADRLRQVVANLLSNALKYSAAGRPVTLALRTTGHEATATVRDEGAGIPPESLPHLFERFYRAPGVDVQSGSYQGLGLGLFLSKAIVEQHAGRIWAESVPGEGSVFTFSVPLLA